MANYKRPKRTYLVTGSNVDLVDADTFLNNESTGAVNLANGEMGIFAADDFGSTALNTSIDAGDTIANAPSIQMIVGNANSANPAGATATYPLWVEPYYSSGIIKGSGVLTATKQAVESPTHSVWTIGNAASPIVAADNTTFGINITYRGRIFDEYYSSRASASFEPYVITPDFTALGTAEPVDWIIQNLTKEINQNSLVASPFRNQGNEHVIALAIGANGAAAGTDISGLTAGDVVPVISYANGTTRSLTVTDAMITSIQAAASAASLNAAVEILDIDLSTAGTSTGGTAISFMLLGLDRVQAFKDRIPQTKTRLDVGLTKGFDYLTVYHAQGSNAYEGQGQGRALNLDYKATHGQRRYYLNQITDPVIEFPSPIDEDTTYVQYIIHHVHASQNSVGAWVENPQQEILLVPSTHTTTVADVDAILGPWITSANGVGIVTL
jgi:hypothetical protein